MTERAARRGKIGLSELGCGDDDLKYVQLLQQVPVLRYRCPRGTPNIMLVPRSQKNIPGWRD